MRYYGLTIKGNNSHFETTKKIKLKDYGYVNAICGVNGYVYNYLKNNVNFLIYREEGNNTLAVFSFDERFISYNDAVAALIDNLNTCFEFRGFKTEPYEITMNDYIEAIHECKRHQLFERWGGSVLYDNAKLWLYEFNGRNDKVIIPYEYREILVSGEKPGIIDIYDDSLKNELLNIREHSSETDNKGIMAHYFVSANSFDASVDIIKTLASELYNAGRITTKRINVVSDMVWNLYTRSNYFEDMLENSFGGMVVFYLKEKLGSRTPLYGNNCKFISKLFRKYSSKCLFVFAYEKQHTGIAYKILPEIRKNAICVELKEGKGNKKAAENYLKKFIRESEYSKYISSAKEFMKQFNRDDYSQTDVLEIYEKFEPWCLNKKMNGMYNFAPEEDFLMDRDIGNKSPYNELQSLIGLNKVKKQIDSILASHEVEQERKKYKRDDFESGSLHMIFAGNPGTAKTKVARLFAGIAKEKGIVSSGVFVEIGGMDLNCIVPDLIRDKFDEAKGGVLFVDEAYSMTLSVSVATFIQEMENHRDEVIVIMAGYNEKMENFLKLNEGLKSRIPHWVDFPDYDADELTEIFKYMAKQRNFILDDGAVEEAKYIFKKAGCITDFGNGRYVRNILDQALVNQSSRLMAKKKDASLISKSELFTIKKEDITSLDELQNKEDETDSRKRKEGDAIKELDEMIGLKSVKDIIHKAVASAKLNKRCMDKGIKREKTTMHMVFTGNPGTAKTTVARLFAEIMKDEKILDLGKFVEAGRADIIGTYVGETAPKVKAKFKEAQGGVLFIDEAYSLLDERKGSYGDEAISTIVQEMENQRDKVVVIFAGYPEPMKEFIDRNPGMKSRIAFTVDFEDYSKEDLLGITDLMLSKKKYTLTKGAKKKIEEIFDKIIDKNDFGNGRFVRKMIEKAELNQAVRLSPVPDEELTEKTAFTLVADDIPSFEELEMKNNDKEKVPLGFAC